MKDGRAILRLANFTGARPSTLMDDADVYHVVSLATFVWTKEQSKLGYPPLKLSQYKQKTDCKEIYK